VRYFHNLWRISVVWESETEGLLPPLIFYYGDILLNDMSSGNLHNVFLSDFGFIINFLKLIRLPFSCFWQSFFNVYKTHFSAKISANKTYKCSDSIVLSVSITCDSNFYLTMAFLLLY
jgi:hypothetical protein